VRLCAQRVRVRVIATRRGRVAVIVVISALIHRAVPLGQPWGYGVPGARQRVQSGCGGLSATAQA